MLRKFFICLLPLFLLLQGCSGVLKSTGLETYYTDSNISFHILQQLKKTPHLYQRSHIVITVYQSNVLIAGQVLLPEQRIQTQQIVQGVPGVRRIYNELEIAGQTTTLTRSSDAWITSKVLANMLGNKKFVSRKIKVVTENGIVYLLGTVNLQQANLASAIARRVPGVQKVVSFFIIKP